jgi:hypothetical protein
VVGFVDDDLFKQGLRIRGVNVIGKREDIPRLVRKYDVGLLVFAIHNIQESERRHLLEICAATPTRLVELPDILRALNGRGHTPPQGDAFATGAPRPLAGRLTPQTAPFAAGELEDILAELEQLAQAGDLAALRTRLAELRDSSSSSLSDSSSGNLSGEAVPFQEGTGYPG